MDELTLLRQFRADVPASLRARQQARERLERLIEGRRYRHRPRLPALIAAIALLIARSAAQPTGSPASNFSATQLLTP
jgi:hypothetical protein